MRCSSPRRQEATRASTSSLMLFFSCLALVSNAVWAQESAITTANLVFEPHPLPVTNFTEPAFVTVDAATSKAKQLDTAMSFEEQDALQEATLNAAMATYGESGAEAAKAFEAFADWNLDAFLQRSSIGHDTSSINGAMLATQRMTGSRGAAGDLEMARSQNPFESTIYNLYLAKKNYLQALAALTQQPDYTNPQLLVLERKLQKTLFLSTHRENVIYEPDFYLARRASATGTRLEVSTQALLNSPDYSDGVQSFGRQLKYIDSNRARTAEQVAQALLEEADWDLLFARVPQSTEKYDGAFRFFESSPVVKERAQALAAPAVPVVLPAFMPAPNSRERLGIAADTDLSWFGYYDVSFGIQKNGQTRSLKILGRGGNVTEDMEMRLRQYINKLVFRPHYVAGKLDTGARSFRYYVGY